MRGRPDRGRRQPLAEAPPGARAGKLRGQRSQLLTVDQEHAAVARRHALAAAEAQHPQVAPPAHGARLPAAAQRLGGVVDHQGTVAPDPLELAVRGGEAEHVAEHHRGRILAHARLQVPHVEVEGGRAHVAQPHPRPRRRRGRGHRVGRVRGQDHRPAARRLHGLQALLAVLEVRLEDRVPEGLVDRARDVVPGLLAAARLFPFIEAIGGNEATPRFKALAKERLFDRRLRPRVDLGLDIFVPGPFRSIAPAGQPDPVADDDGKLLRGGRVVARSEIDIIFQAKCPVLEDDTPETLAQRIHLLEHANYPLVIETLLKQS